MTKQTTELWKDAYRNGYGPGPYDSVTTRVLRHVLDAARPGSSVLDLGCGLANHIEMYGQYDVDVTLVDAVDLRSRLVATTGAWASFVHCDAVAFLRACAPGSYDVIVVTKLLHSLPVDARAAVLAELRRVAPRSCTLILSVASDADPTRATDQPAAGEPNWALTGAHEGYPTWRSYFSREQVLSLAAPLGSIVSAEEYSAPSGIKGRDARSYWMLVVRAAQVATCTGGSTPRAQQHG